MKRSVLLIHYNMQEGLSMRIAFSIILLAVLCGCNNKPTHRAPESIKQEQSRGPFGFWRGMTKQEIIDIVGRESITGEEKTGMLSLSRAPLPYPAFDSYIVYLDADAGLVKVVAVGKTINTNDAGDQIKSEFRDLREGLLNKYGKPSGDIDKLRAGSIWTGRNEWMMALLKEDRILASYWLELPSKPNGITGIALGANPLNSGAAYISTSYEFEGFVKYSEKVKANRDSVL